MHKTLAFIGILVTSLYLATMIWGVGIDLRAIRELGLNELGDFLAGVFGPIAIFWLILGYFQQGIGLKQNSDALELQATELANSVQQQKELVEVTREQLKTEMEILQEDRNRIKSNQEPKFVFSEVGAMIIGGTAYKFRFTLTNIGSAISGVKFSIGAEIEKFSPRKFITINQSETKSFQLELAELGPLKHNVPVTIIYINGENVTQTKVFNIVPNDETGASGTFRETTS